MAVRQTKSRPATIFPYPAPLAAAGGVALLGFGALTLFWLSGRWRSGRRGLPDYRSATIGDGIVIPAMVGILIGALRNEALPPTQHERRIALAAGLTGIATGAAVQLSWLLDPNPVTNWTLPKPHHFNVPGWYHACFLTATSGALAALAVTAARRVRTASSEARNAAPAGPWLGLLVGSGIGFVTLLAVDSADSSRTTAGLGTIAATSAATLAGLAACGWAVRWDKRHLRRTAVIALPVVALVNAVALIAIPLH
jgi:hypothetical protein